MMCGEGGGGREGGREGGEDGWGTGELRELYTPGFRYASAAK